MNNILKMGAQYVILLLWGLYALYLALFGNILLFPKDSIELIVPLVLQIIIFVLFYRIFKAKFSFTTKATAIICCLLVIIWHFNLIHGISRRTVIVIFAVIPIVLTAVGYLIRKIRKTDQVSILKSFGVSWIITFANFIIATFTFYILHYWV